MSDEIGDYQRGFEWGMLVGLNAAASVLRDGGNLASVVKLGDEMRHVRRRRRMAADGLVEGQLSDLYMAIPLGHPGDLGLSASPAEEAMVEASFVGHRFGPPLPA